MASRAFLSGINDYKTIGDLRGCINDTLSLKRLLIDEFQFDADQIRVRTDAEVTKSELNKGWKWLLKDAKPGDRLVFHFSGHGSYTADTDGEAGEADFRDELLCLYGMDWKDPKTYLLDDELRAWTEGIPDGVDVTFVLDCCHSGTGTRFVAPELSRAVKTDFLTAGSLSLDHVAAERSRGEVSAATRSMDEIAGVRPATPDEIDRHTVLARFAPPPIEVQVAIADATQSRSFRGVFKQTRSRGDGEETMNHVLWSGCRDDQTSADAFIGNDFHGAFTYYFCDAIRKAGEDRTASSVIRSLRSRLREERFDQIPQLEPSSTSSVVFGGKKVGGGDDAGIGDDGTDSGSPSLPNISAADWKQLLATLQQIADHLASIQPGSGREGLLIGERASGQALVYVHGICEHAAHYSDEWWDAMAPYLSSQTRNALDANRKEVLWSKHVSKMNRELSREVDPVQQQEMELMLEAILEERMAREAAEQIAERAERSADRGIDREIEGAVPRAAFGIPGLDCVDDFVKYLSSDRIRRLVIDECTDVVRPLLQQGKSIELISHSWGTVVAYEALRSLEREGLPGRVHNWFTVGAALAIKFVTKRLRPDDGRKPQMVDHWINLNARGDGVGGSLIATGMQFDREFLRLDPFGCSSTFGFVSPACAHSSYFKSGNSRVNRDVFAHSIDQV
ncbi:caspase family protein [Novipirellula sp.]|uniref:caspase family protein n=1 Tax=Novipirellula sp. TaxID=2795430 RepID=UPI003566A2FE